MSEKSEITKNDTAWEKLFNKYQILQGVARNDCFIITAGQINEFREARLMTKFDHQANLPELFSKNKLAILPITRGNYIISNFEAYKKFPEPEKEIYHIELPEFIESIDYNNITSEAIAINCAYASNLLTDFLEDIELLPTVSGRMSSSIFSFNILNTATKNKVLLNVNNSQVEIDGGYEGHRSLSIIEAKNFISEDFLIRQLYYPFRLWKGKIKKKVKPIFLVYSNGVFTLYEYEFQDPNNYNSLVLVKQKNYSFESVDISLNDIQKVLNSSLTVPEPEISFPQADSFKRVINLCELLFEKEMTKDEITSNFAFDSRQTNYYTDAGRYLGLIDKRNEERVPIYSLSEKGRKVLKMQYKSRQLEFVNLILEHQIFKKVFKKNLDRGEMPSKNEIMEYMKKENLYNIGQDSTYKRRASTISGWVNWILELQR